MTENREQTSLVEAQRPLGSGLALHGLLANRSDRLKSALEGTGISADRFIEGVVQAVAKNPSLLACSRESVLMACLEAAQIGLEPTGLLNQAWLVPYKTTARLMIGYAGLITLLDRSGGYDFIEAVLLYEHDDFEVTRGTAPGIHHVPAPADQRGRFGHESGYGGYWVAWRKGSSRPQFDVMSFAEMEKRRNASKRAEQDMWAAWPEEMYRKTILRWGMKSMPLTPIIQRALAYEQESMDLPEDEARREERESDRRRGLLDRIAHGSAPDGPGSPAESAEPTDTGEQPEAPERAADGLAEDGLPPMR